MDIFNADTPLIFSSYEEITNSRLNFTSEIDTSSTQIVQIIGVYRFQEKHPCGKKGCHQPHLNGYLALTSDDRETLIGNVCGQEWGGSNFVLLRNQVKRKLEQQKRRSIVYEAIRSSGQLMQRVQDLKNRTHGAAWVGRAHSRLISECDPSIIHDLTSRARKGQYLVTNSRRKTSVEMQVDKRSEFIEETVGQYVGLDFLRHDLREVLIDRLQTRLEILSKLNPDILPTPTLNKWAKEVQSFDSEFSLCEQIINNAVTFFSSPLNFDLIKAVHKDHKHLKSVPWMIL